MIDFFCFRYVIYAYAYAYMLPRGYRYIRRAPILLTPSMSYIDRETGVPAYDKYA